jgi:hypothetical protein
MEWIAVAALAIGVRRALVARGREMHGYLTGTEVLRQGSD